ncbi:Glutamate synthase domain-containing protein [Plasmodiophora brassicae]
MLGRGRRLPSARCCWVSSTPSGVPPARKRNGKVWGWERKMSGDNRFPDWIAAWTRQRFYKVSSMGFVATASAMAILGPEAITPWALAIPASTFFLVGMRDVRQHRHSIRRNFPVLGRIRYLFESIRPEIRQYFVESDSEAVPFSREHRSVVYARSKLMPDALPFGTREDVYNPGYEFVCHSIWPVAVPPENQRVLIGGPDCRKPYSASLLNISGMSYGAISENAIRALNLSAAMGNYYHNTGEGGVSRFHLEHGGDIVWNIGTAYFGCRSPDGRFDPGKFAETAALDNIKMIELKLSQGAKPAHGGMLPQSKITAAISETRGIPMDRDCLSPPQHSAFSTPRELAAFIGTLRELSGGKPVGIKLCIGRFDEFIMLAHAFQETGIVPDFITVDGGEGGTGAAPPEFSDRVGTPLVEGLRFVDNVLIGADLRHRIKIIASGKVLTGFSIVKNLALGADLCNSARAFMFALGCIQSLKCNTNTCPTGIATQDPNLMYGLVAPDKAVRCYNFHTKTVEIAVDMIGSVGCTSPDLLRPGHIKKRISETQTASYEELYPTIPAGSLLKGTAPIFLQKIWDRTRAHQ